MTDEQLLQQCELRLLRRGGPGGQHRNKVETAVVLTHQPSGVSAEANERRSQADNRAVALFRLRCLLALHVRGELLANQPSSLWRERRVGNKIRVATAHECFPSLLAELMDRLFALEFDLVRVALFFEVSPSQLVRFLRSYPPSLALVNQHRQQLGLHRLH
ncbi:MAG: peptide chain release factor-like protein [Planctomycetales bacterium]|nr:peptide chain release factor-like protein [Planctomycetales bacterium]